MGRYSKLDEDLTIYGTRFLRGTRMTSVSVDDIEVSKKNKDFGVGIRMSVTMIL